MTVTNQNWPSKGEIQIKVQIHKDMQTNFLPQKKQNLFWLTSFNKNTSKKSLIFLTERFLYQDFVHKKTTRKTGAGPTCRPQRQGRFSAVFIEQKVNSQVKHRLRSKPRLVQQKVNKNKNEQIQNTRFKTTAMSNKQRSKKHRTQWHTIEDTSINAHKVTW